MSEIVRVPSVQDMDDQILIKHMAARHDEDLRFDISKPEPEQKKPRLRGSGKVWRTFHDKMHELYDGRTDGARGMYDHVHKEPNNGD